jgi:hypothetical protein
MCGTVSQLSALTALQSLRLQHFILEPSQLHGLSQLIQLHLIDVAFKPTQMQELLGKLTRMQQLLITQESSKAYSKGAQVQHEGEQERAWPAASAAYAGLTASSQQQEVHLADCRLPPGVWQYAFPAGRQLMQLGSLHAVCTDWPVEEVAGYAFVEAGQGAGPQPLAGRDLAVILAACPNLERWCVW